MCVFISFETHLALSLTLNRFGKTYTPKVFIYSLRCKLNYTRGAAKPCQ